MTKLFANTKKYAISPFVGSKGLTGITKGDVGSNLGTNTTKTKRRPPGRGATTPLGGRHSKL